jgi:hypothetical protein
MLEGVLEIRKQPLTHEVAYGSLLKGRRRTIHAQVVEAIERLNADRLSEMADVRCEPGDDDIDFELAQTVPPIREDGLPRAFVRVSGALRCGISIRPRSASGQQRRLGARLH